MYLNHKKIAAAAVIGAAIISWFPAGTLNALTLPGAAGTTPGVIAQISTQIADPVSSQPSATPELTVAAPSAMDIWLDKLAFKESGNNADLKILDVNNKYSYGCLQFQEGTFRTYALKYGLITPATPTESVIYNCELQKKLAKLMLAANPSMWRAWYNSSKSPEVGMPPTTEQSA